MKTQLLFAWILAVGVLLPGPARAEGSAVLSVDDTESIVAQKGNEVTVEGLVHSAFWVRGVLLITFREQEEGFLAASFTRYRRALDEGFDGDFLKAVQGKKIQIRGTVTEHRGRPQIVVEAPDQVTVLGEDGH